MPEAFDGESIARLRIVEEAKARTGFLDLGGLGLTRLPPNLFELQHLRVLNLGDGIASDGTGYRREYRSIHITARNRVAHDIGLLAALRDLEVLSVSETDCDTLEPLSALPKLSWLICSSTEFVTIACAPPPKPVVSASCATRRRCAPATASRHSCAASAEATACSSS
jgi:internalin A